MTALLFAVCLAQLPDGVIDARVTVEPPEAPFNKQVTVTVRVEAEPEREIEIPLVPSEAFHGLEIYGGPDQSRTVTERQTQLVTTVFTLDPIWPRDYPIDPFVVEADGKSFQIPAPAIRIRDLTPEEEAEAMSEAPPAPPADVPPPLYAPWIVGGMIAVAAVVLAIWYLRAKPKRTPATPERAPWDIAYDRLHQLDAAGLPAAGKFGRYYVELSYILRTYVEARYDLHAPERTTPEFLDEASKAGVLTEDQEAMLASFLKLCDRVKFAQYTSSVEEAEQSMADILQFVDESIPQPVSEHAEEAA